MSRRRGNLGGGAFLEIASSLALLAMTVGRTPRNDKATMCRQGIEGIPNIAKLPQAAYNLADTDSA